MKVEARRLVDQVLVADEPCLGAVFCTYTFDPAYFEEHVLRALLRMSGDPDEDGARYHEEARAALRETPVACFVDASVRRGGRNQGSQSVVGPIGHRWRPPAGPNRRQVTGIPRHMRSTASGPASDVTM